MMAATFVMIQEGKVQISLTQIWRKDLGLNDCNDGLSHEYMMGVMVPTMELEGCYRYPFS
jgi:hypothetical protein